MIYRIAYLALLNLPTVALGCGFGWLLAHAIWWATLYWITTPFAWPPRRMVDRMNAATLHPLDAGLLERGEPCSGLPFPPNGWSLVLEWGLGYALESKNGLRVIIDCAMKSDNRWWVHVSVSHSRATPTHDEMARVKRDFLGDRYAYAVYPPLERYVNIHHHCLHLWALAEGNGAVLPEFSGEVCGVVSI